MKRGICTLALLSVALPQVASAQDVDTSTSSVEPSNDATIADETEETEAGEANDPELESSSEGDEPEESPEPTQPESVTLEDETPEAATDGGRGPSGANPGAAAGPQGELIKGPPEPEFDPALEPEVYWEGDADDHNPGYVPGYGGYRGLGLNPNIPRAGKTAGGLQAPPGSDTWDEDWAFHFHGYLESTLRAGFGKREDPATGQSETTIHANPIVPGRFGDFEATQSVPGPWAQLNFTYGNPYVAATVIFAGFNQNAGASYGYPSSQLGFNDVYLTLRAPDMPGLRLKAIAGAFQDRYGAMAQYSEGNYGHSIVAYTRGTGVTVVGDFDLAGEFVGLFEAGFKGNIDKAPIGIEPNDANGYADAQNGAGYVGHAHLGVAWKDFDLSGHALYAFSKDDRLPDVPIRPGEPVAGEQPNGSIGTFGLTLRAIGQPYGHFFIGGAHTVAKNARSVPRVINILNADGGRGLMEEYLGMRSNGNGNLTHAGFQWDTSLQQFLHHPGFFRSDSWDIRGSFFATFVHVNSEQETSALPGDDVQFDGANKFKAGTEIMWSIFPWLAASARYDFVGPELSDKEQSFNIISPRLIFRTNFLAHEQINIRYTRWFYGDEVRIQNVAPNDPQGLDNQMIALQANMYW